MAARVQRQARAVVRELSRWPGANERRDAKTARAVNCPRWAASWLAAAGWAVKRDIVKGPAASKRCVHAALWHRR
jgi:hypothetical protein